MKILIVILLASVTVHLYADKKWIPIESINKTKNQKKSSAVEVKVSQFQPIRKLVKSAVVIKQLLDGSKRGKTTSNDGKNWYTLDNKGK